jgi:hypothetical protein
MSVSRLPAWHGTVATRLKEFDRAGVIRFSEIFQQVGRNGFLRWPKSLKIHFLLVVK